MCEVNLDVPDGYLIAHRFFTLPRREMSETALYTGNTSGKSATLARVEGACESKSEFSKLKRRPSLRGFSNFLGRVVRTVATLPRDRHSRKHDIHDSDDVDDYIQYNENEIPGVIGISNHGNTCFINAVIQCLSNTDVLAEYFITGQYKVDLCRKSKVNAKKFGTKGEITEQFALTLKSIWSCQYNSEVSSQFKTYIEKYAKHFRGNEQHDAQEFLMWLLDKVHEDLNSATKRKYKRIKSSLGRPDEIVAAETLANHQRCNASFVQDIFQAQFRSSLRCPSCCKESNTFDPFLCISVPIIQRQQRSLLVNIVYFNQQPRQVRMGFSVESSASVAQLRRLVAEDAGVTPHRCLLCLLDGTGFTQTLIDSESVCTIGECEQLYCIELPPSDLKADLTQEAPLTLVWCNLRLSDDSGTPHRFGSPYLMQVPRDVLYEDLQKLLLKEMTSIVKPEALSVSQQVPLFTLRVSDGLPVDHTVSHPLLTEPIEQHLATTSNPNPTTPTPPPHPASTHVKLLIEWEQDAIDAVLSTIEDQVEVHRTVREVAGQSLSPVTLQECLQLYTKTERLGPDDSWQCPCCQSSQQAEKRLSLWSVPDILVIHLKRFRQTNNQRCMSKLTAQVDFPLRDLDMGHHLAGRPSSTSSSGSVGDPVDLTADQTAGTLADRLQQVWSPWRRNHNQHQLPRRCSDATAAGAARGPDQDSEPPAAVTDPQNVYQLYAVCYHHGRDLLSGHYTALCRNSTDGCWYNFDDTRVERVDEADIVTPDAYILFYQRKSLQIDHPGDDARRHWAYRIRAFPLPTPKSDGGVTSGVTSSTVPNTVDTKPAVTQSRSACESVLKEEQEQVDLAEEVIEGCQDFSISGTTSRQSHQAPLALQEPSDGLCDSSRSGRSTLRPLSANQSAASPSPTNGRPTSLPAQSVLTNKGGGASRSLTSLVAGTNDSANNSPDDEESPQKPSKPQVIVIGHNSGEVMYEQAHSYGDNIKIFVSHPPPSDGSSVCSDDTHQFLPLPSGGASAAAATAVDGR